MGPLLLMGPYLFRQASFLVNDINFNWPRWFYPSGSMEALPVHYGRTGAVRNPHGPGMTSESEYAWIKLLLLDVD